MRRRRLAVRSTLGYVDRERVERELQALRQLMEAHQPSGEAARCSATTSVMNYPAIRCEKPAGHPGNHHAHVIGHELFLDQDGHTIKARSWQVEWKGS